MRRRRERDDLRPDLTPLMDIMFLLIIFFIVTTVFKKKEALINLKLPQTEGGLKAKENPKSILIELTKDGFAVNRKKLLLKDFSDYCKKLKDQMIPIDIRVDKNVVYNRVVQVLSVLQKHNLSNLTLITEVK
jgi:biopolymer transport protein ExbD